MSSSGDREADIAQGRALGRLEAAVARLLEERRIEAERVEHAEQQVAALEARLDQIASDGANPVELKAEISKLEKENAELADRIRGGREGVERLLSRIRFLRGQREG